MVVCSDNRLEEEEGDNYGTKDNMAVMVVVDLFEGGFNDLCGLGLRIIHTSSCTTATQTPTPKPVKSIASPRIWQEACIQSNDLALKTWKSNFQDRAPSGRIKITVRPMITPWTLSERCLVTLDGERGARSWKWAWSWRLGPDSGSAVAMVRKAEMTQQRTIEEAEALILLDLLFQLLARVVNAEG